MRGSDILLYTVIEHDPSAPLPAHVAKYRTRREPPDVPTMCSNVYCREWVWEAEPECSRCGTPRAT